VTEARTADTTMTPPAPSPWPIAEATLAALPSSRYLWDTALPVRAATEADEARWSAQKSDLAWAAGNGDPYGVLPVPASPPVLPVPTASDVPAIPAAPPAPAVPPVPPTAASNREDDKAEQRAKSDLARWTGHAPGSPEALAAYQDASNAIHYEMADADPAGPDGTAIIPAAHAETETLPAITADTAEEKS
jgi:hypothetical protein